MNRYDRDYDGGYDRDYGPPRRRGYASDFGMWGDEWGSAQGAGFNDYGVGLYRAWGTPAEARGYDDRGVYRRGFRGAGQGGAQPRSRELSDRDVRELVTRNLERDEWLRAERISVEVENRVVTLRGRVEDYMESRYAWDDAWETAGVRGVLNRLVVGEEGSEAPRE